jgi:two-component system NtrC family sensor kinase
MPKKEIMKNKISYKLILTVGGVAITIIAVFSYISIDSQKQALIAQIEQNANQLSETVKSSTKYDMLLNQRERIHRIIDTIGKQEGIEKVRVFNKEGEIIYSSAKDEIGNLVDKQAESCFACHAADQPLEKLSIPERTRIFKVKNHSKNLGIINPIYNESGCWQASCHAHQASQSVLGVLDVTMSLDEVERQIAAQQIEMTMFVLIAIIGISFILWFLVQKLVGKPVSELVKATNVVAAGNLDYKIKNYKQDELGHLAHSFNEMTQKLAEAQRQIIQSDKLASLGRLAAGVAHEINNPLTGVLTYSSFLLKRVGNDGEMKNDLEVIVRETKRCRDIVKGLLDFARPAPVEKTRVALSKVIEQVLTIMENQLQFKNIRVEKQIGDSLPTIFADHNQMQQVLMNLLVNAVDAIPPQGGEIAIRAHSVRSEGKEYVEVSVHDTGCGIAQENLSKIFEPFYTKGQKGTGLGLAVVWGIIEKHGGTIKVASTVDQGTTFTVRLPVNQQIANEKIKALRDAAGVSHKIGG